jgi:mRNA interferase MazF
VSGIKYRQKEIVLVPFPYSDLSSSKRRPVLIVSSDFYNQNFDDVVVCVITTNLRKDSFSVELESSDLDIGVLPESSVVKAHKLFTIHQDKIIKKFSVVNDDYFDKVAVKIKQLIKSSK